MTWSYYGTPSHSLQCSSTVWMTPSTSVTVTPSFSTLQTSQPRAVDSGVSSTLHDQYGCSSQQRPVYGMCDYPTGGAPLLQPLPLQVSHDFLLGCTTVLCIDYCSNNEALYNYCFINLMNVTLVQLTGYTYGDYIYVTGFVKRGLIRTIINI